MTWHPRSSPPGAHHGAGTYCLHLLHLQQRQFRGSVSGRLGTGHGGGGWPQGPLLPGGPLEHDAGVLHGLVQKVLAAALAGAGKLLGARGLQGRQREGAAQAVQHSTPPASPTAGCPRPCAHPAPSLGKALHLPSPPAHSPSPLPAMTLVSHLPSPATRLSARKPGPGQSHSQQSRRPEQGPD